MPIINELAKAAGATSVTSLVDGYTRPLVTPYREINPLKYELKRVVMCVRHGDRAPIASKIGNYVPSHEVKEFWESRLPPHEVLEELNQQIPLDLAGPELADSHRRPYAQLTLRGVQQLKALGRWAWQIYGPQGYKLLSTGDQQEAYFRSTGINRTVQTAQSLAVGMGIRDGRNKVFARLVTEETMFPHAQKKCIPLIKLHKARNTFFSIPGINVEEVVRLVQDGMGVEPEKSLPGVDPRFDTRTAMAMREVLWCHMVHGLTLPGRVPGELAMLFSDVLAHYYNSYHSAPGSLRLAIGRFLSELWPLMEAPSEEAPHTGGHAAFRSPKSAKMVVFAGHDTTLMPLLCVLGTPGKDFENKWPDYASFIVFEIFKKKETKEEHGGFSSVRAEGAGNTSPSGLYVRVLYNGKPLVLQSCGRELIPVETLQHLMQSHSISSEEYSRVSDLDAYPWEV